MDSSRPKVVVVGAGITGVVCAERIIREFRNVDVTLLSDKFSPSTTGDGAAGLWGDYLSGNTCQEKMHKWLKETYNVLENFNFSAEGVLTGVTQIYGYRLDKKSSPQETPYWKNIVHGFQNLDEEQRKLFGTDFTEGIGFTSYTVECCKILPYLMRNFAINGGNILHGRIDNLEQLAGKFDIVINCTGLGARQIVPDPSVIPIRGQIMQVKAPWIKTFILNDNGGNYIIPNIDVVVLGGTCQEGNFNLKVDSEDAHKIWQGCSKILPSLKHSKFVRNWVGLRPGRFSVRLERETLSVANTQKKLEVIHNYGHGGSGISLAWGCATDVITLIEECLRSGKPNITSAKL